MMKKSKIISSPNKLSSIRRKKIEMLISEKEKHWLTEENKLTRLLDEWELLPEVMDYVQLGKCFLAPGYPEEDYRKLGKRIADYEKGFFGKYGYLSWQGSVCFVRNNSFSYNEIQKVLEEIVMLKVYGTELCRDCVACKYNFDHYGLVYQYIDITKNIRDLKKFFCFRETN